jgi:hypothetical protein
VNYSPRSMRPQEIIVLSFSTQRSNPVASIQG